MSVSKVKLIKIQYRNELNKSFQDRFIMSGNACVF